MILLILHNCMFYTLFVNLVNNRILKQEQEKHCLKIEKIQYFFFFAFS